VPSRRPLKGEDVLVAEWRRGVIFFTVWPKKKIHVERGITNGVHRNGKIKGKGRVFS